MPLPVPQPASTTSNRMTLPPSNNERPRLFLNFLEARQIPPRRNKGNGKTRAYPSLLSLISETPKAASVAGAVIVSVEVPGLAPTVTGDCETLQVANGAGPFTVQFRSTCPEKPFCPSSVKTSFTCAPVCVV